MNKVTQIDYQISLLEMRGSNLSVFEQNKLNSLKEQKTLMDQQGIKLKPTIVPRFPLPPPPPAETNFEISVLPNKSNEAKLLVGVDKEAVGKNDAPNKMIVNNKSKAKVATHGKIARGQGVSSSFLKFVKYSREKQNNDNSLSKLDLNHLRLTWSKMNVSEKKPFIDMVKVQKTAVGDKVIKDVTNKSKSDEEKKERKAAADKKYREKMIEARTNYRTEQETLLEKMLELIIFKKGKMKDLQLFVKNIRDDITETQKKKIVAIESMVEKDTELMVLKEQFKVLHKIHKKCARSDQDNE